MAATLDPRKTPSQARARATWDAIIEAAARILADGGLSAFNTNAVAERAGVSIGTLYQYFPNKDALVAALIAREQQTRAAALGQIAGAFAGRPLAEIVAGLIDAAVEGERRNSRLAVSLDHEEMRLPVASLIGNAATMIDAYLARALAPHVANPLEAARTIRVIARALIDDALNADPALPERARVETFAAVMGYLDKVGPGA